mgnify:CR=1 FL=1
MQFFGKNEKYYVGSLHCGAGRSAFLQIELSRTPCDIEEMSALPPIKHGLSDGVDPIRIKQSAQDSLEKANNYLGTEYYIRKIAYVPNDSTHYDLHGRLVFEIIRHLENGGEFESVASNT